MANPAASETARLTGVSRLFAFDRMRPRTREAIGFYLCILPWILGFLAFTLGPMIYSLYLSLT